MRRRRFFPHLALIAAPGGGATAAGDIEKGRALHAQHCVSRHGADPAGAPDWRRPERDDRFPAPPHDEARAILALTGSNRHKGVRGLRMFQAAPTASEGTDQASPHAPEGKRPARDIGGRTRGRHDGT